MRKQVHPTEPLAILNYTEKCQYERYWTNITRQCRGLIYHTETLEVVARPFAKFHNLSEHTDEEISALVGEPCEVWDKLDGSLGVIHSVSDGWAVATRGSFASEQAIHATALLRARYPQYLPAPGVTVLCEIIYPSNRIVVDYAGLDDLVLLGGVNVATGRTVPFVDVAADWPGPKATLFPHRSLSEALAAPEQPNCEGYVIRFTASDKRIKCKTAEYVRLHRLVTGVTARVVWTHAGVCDLAALGMDARRIAQTMMLDRTEVEQILTAVPGGDWMTPFLDAVPEEFAAWVKGTAATVTAAVDAWETEQRTTFAALDVTAEDRRAAAAKICAFPKDRQGALFALLDGKPIRPIAWRVSRPAHEVPFASASEDVA